MRVKELIQKLEDLQMDDYIVVQERPISGVAAVAHVNTSILFADGVDKFLKISFYPLSQGDYRYPDFSIEEDA